MTSTATIEGGFANAAPFVAGIGPFSVALGDLNGDFKPDLVTANYLDASVSVLFHQ